MRDRWEEDIPADIAGARLWWAENEKRFLGENPGPVPARRGAKGFQKTNVRYLMHKSRMAPRSLTNYVGAILGVMERYYADVEEPAEAGVTCEIIPGINSGLVVWPEDDNLLEELNSIEVPRVEGGPLIFQILGELAGGFRSEKNPEWQECGTPSGSDWSYSPGTF